MIYKNRRSDVEIIDTILTGVHGEVKKTRLLNQAHICYYQFNDYFTFLLNNGFISERPVDTRKKVYMITDRGKQLHESIQSLLAWTEKDRLVE